MITFSDKNGYEYVMTMDELNEMFISLSDFPSLGWKIIDIA